MSDPFLPRAVQIESRQRETADVFTLSLSSPAAYGRFSPGQFNMLYVPGRGEAAISISGDPADAARLTHTVRAVGNVTAALCEARPPERIGLRGPFGQGWPLAEAEGKELLLLAGGIGLAPLRPVLYAALAAPERFSRITLLLGARSPADLLYSRQLLEWKARGRLQLLASVDSATPDWRGDIGVITGLIPRAEFDPKRVLAMICGPEIMMRFCVRELRARGVPGEAIHVSLERNMKCALGVCGHCQLGPYFLCRNGPVFAYPQVEHYLMTREF